MEIVLSTEKCPSFILKLLCKLDSDAPFVYSNTIVNNAFV